MTRAAVQTPGKLLLTLDQAAAELSIGLTALTALIDDGRLPAVRTPGTKRGRRIKRADLERFVAELEHA